MDNITNKNAEALIKSYLPDNSILADMSNFFSVFADATRIKILTALSISEICVGDISKILGLNQTTVSHQLRILRDADFVKVRRDGKTLYYSITTNAINDIMLTGTIYLGYNDKKAI